MVAMAVGGEEREGNEAANGGGQWGPLSLGGEAN